VAGGDCAGFHFAQGGADVLGPYLTKVVVDRYLAPVRGLHTPLDHYLSAQATGWHRTDCHPLRWPFALQFSAGISSNLLHAVGGQKTMFDMRAQIFRHLQRMHIGFYDKNPVGRLVTRVTTDVDALNEMFTSGVVSIFEDVFVLAGIIAIMLRMTGSWR
jgi:ATP-binding cassette, subfamily B, multidrug efflux pump